VALIMLYLSPSSLLGEAIPQPFDKKAIQLARKKLLAELELNEGNDLQIRGRSYGKSDIINYFEDLLKENVLEYHAAISQDKVLLVFLEEADIQPGERFAKNQLYTDPFFIRWISTWLPDRSGASPSNASNHRAISPLPPFSAIHT
jgi:hypothetical protein